MRDLRSDLLDKEETEPPAAASPQTDQVTGELPDPTLDPDADDLDAEERRQRRRRVALGAGLSALAVAGAATGVLVWTGQARPLARSVRWFFDPPPPVAITVTPAADTTGVRLDAPVRVVAEHGKLTKVEVATEHGRTLRGEFTAGGRRWRSTAPLQPGVSYTVRWSAVNAQEKSRRDTAGFTTLTPAGELEIERMLPLDGETVGVGQPVILTFSHPVTDKEAVERALTVTSSTGAVGGWSWTGDQQIRYRPAQYWPTRSTVEVIADLDGVDAGDGVWGVHDWSLGFEVGRKQVSTVDVNTHQMTVKVDGEVVREMPMSSGKPGWETQNGVHWVMGKLAYVIMDSATFGMPGLYRQGVSWATRISGDGEFVHAAPWSVGSQGSSNVSHGCINLSTENARWFFEMAQRGDVVEVVGSPKPPQPNDGLIAWNQNFAEWSQGSAMPDQPSLVQPI